MSVIERSTPVLEDKRVGSCKESVLCRMNILWILLYIIGVGIFMIGTPKYVDDLWYQYLMRDWYEKQSVTDPTWAGNVFRAGVPWREVWHTWMSHFHGDNSRLCNLVATFVLLFPKWVGSGISLFLWWKAMSASFRLAGVSWRTFSAVPVVLLLWSVGIPWSQHMGALDYQCNYVWSTALMLMYLLFVINAKPGKAMLVLVFGAGLIVGAWHEGFTLPVLAGMLTVLLCVKDYRQPRYIVAIVSLAFGLVYLMTFPPVMGRVRTETLYKSYSIVMLLRTLLKHPSAVIFFIMLVYLVTKKSLRNRIKEPLIIFLSTSAIVSLTMEFALTQTRRVGWWADIASVIGIIYLLKNTVSRSVFSRRKLVLVVSALSLSATIAYWSLVDYYTMRLVKEYNEVLNLYVNKKQTTLFKKITTFNDLPFYSFFTPDMGLLQSPMSLGAINGYFRQGKPLTVIPKELEYVTSGMGREIGGGVGIRYVGDYLYVEADVPYGMSARGMADFGWLGKSEVILFCYPFISKGDGRKYVYLYPWHVTWELQFAKMKSFEIIW